MSPVTPPAPPPPPVSTANPLAYEAPSRDEVALRRIAARERAVNLCILGYFVLLVPIALVPPAVRPFVGMAAMALAITGAVFVFLLALALYSKAVGILLGIAALLFPLGLIVLLLVNNRATSVLRRHGVHVGFLGAHPDDIR